MNQHGQDYRGWILSVCVIFPLLFSQCARSAASSAVFQSLSDFQEPAFEKKPTVHLPGSVF